MPAKWNSGCALLWVTLAATSCSESTGEPKVRVERLVAASSAASGSGHLLLTLRLTQTELAVLDFREVRMPLPLRRGAREEPWRVKVEDRLGQVLHLGSLPAPALLRAEFAGPDGAIEVAHPAPGDQVLSIRLPVLPDAATVRLFGPAASGALVERGQASLPTPVAP